ncbi:MAG: LTA synthase family protein [Desulfobacterales bacterium]|jgi:hypothetical protein|nr:LTA synthase family protein [Desulfobacterales bacterium]
MRRRPAKSAAAVKGAAGRRRAGLGAAAAFIFLNAVLNADALAAGAEWAGLLRPAPELLAMAAGIFALARGGRRLPPLVQALLCGLILFFSLFRVADALMFSIFNRPLNLAMDPLRLPDLAFLARTLLTPERCALALAGAALAAAAAGWGVWRALGALLAAPALAPRAWRRVWPALLLASLGAVQLEAPVVASPTLPRLVEEMRFILDMDGVRRADLAAIAAARERAAALQPDLDRLGGAAVLLFVVESYGRTVFSHPDHRARILPTIAAAEAELAAAGFSMCSTFLDSPTAGGGSWLAHATLASGVRVETQIRHDLLLASDLTPLAEFFNRAGYRTLRAMPGTLWPWPAGEFYRYGRTLTAPDFGYRGPRFGFAPMPDQFVLDWVWRNEIRGQGRPLFVEFILVSSHTGFEIQAPYVGEWERIGDGSLFSAIDPVVLPGAWRDPGKLAQAYSGAILYQWTVLKEFIGARVAADALIIVIGDHQPPGPAAGGDRTRSVPLHAISRSRAALAGFLERGCTPGLIPDLPPPHRGMEAFFWDFLEDFSRGGGRRPRAAAAGGTQETTRAGLTPGG